MARDAQFIARAAMEMPAEQRADYVVRACGGDDELRAQVEARLNEQAEASGGAPSPPPQSGAATLPGDDDMHDDARVGAAPDAGQTVGRYRLLQLIGEGGFGSVWMAEQKEPVRRRVALKIIKLGMDTRQVIARFEAERQALAMMDHPNIARVFDAGATDQGRPFFVMELVKGVSIIEYCDTERLDTIARLELFIKVCYAIQHAHQKGIIHRDIKPSNVLVALHDGVPIPKVIDFGIAKATNTELTARTLFTEHRQMIGTPAYMSPEQAEMSGLDIDTRSDIYSLGVLLYELLTDTTPFDGAKLRKAGYAEMLRIIREEEPHRPSTRLSSLARERTTSQQSGPGQPDADRTRATQVARSHRTDPHSLLRALRGDLDWIALKCLDKDRTRRYGTCAALAEDIRRHLADEPVSARPPSAVYRMGKLARRHRVACLGAAVLTIATLLGLGGLAYGLAAVSRQRDRTAAALREVVHTRDQLHAALGFLTDLLASADPDVTQGREVTVRQMLLDAETRIRKGELKGQPIVEATVRRTLGEMFVALGDYDRAAEHLSASVAAFAAHGAAGSADWARAVNALGQARLQRGEYDASEELFLSIAAGEAARNDAGAEASAPITDADLRRAGIGLAQTRSQAGRHDEAIALLRPMLDMDERTLPADLRSEVHKGLGAALEAKGEYDEALQHLSAALLEVGRLKGELSTAYAGVLNDLANTNEAAQRFDVAERAHRQALEIRRQLLGENHPSIGNTLSNLALVLLREGKAEEAEPMFRDALANRRTNLPPTHSGIAITLNNLALALHDLRRFDEAESNFAEAEQIARSTLGPEHVFRIVLRANRAENWIALGRLDEAEAVLVECQGQLAGSLGAQHRRTQKIAQALVRLYEVRGQVDRADFWRAMLPASANISD